jgi:hypothetical protein
VGDSARLNEVEKEDVVRGFNPPLPGQAPIPVGFAANSGKSTGCCLTLPQKHDSQQHHHECWPEPRDSVGKLHEVATDAEREGSEHCQ